MDASQRRIAIAISAGSVALAIAHNSFPSVTIDPVTLTLIGIAVLPWLSPLVKSIEVKGLGKLEFNEIREQAENAEAAAANATRMANLAMAPAANSPDPPDTVIQNLSAEYVQIRKQQKAGSARSAEMTRVMRQMIDVVPLVEKFDFTQYIAAESEGDRLAAIAYAYARPSQSHIELLIDVMVNRETKPFNHYWALQAIERIVSAVGCQALSASQLQTLRQFQNTLRRSTDRAYVIRRILEECDNPPEED